MILNRETVTDKLFVLLTKLMAEPSLAPFVLVGGTALALRLGHRSSEDIDMFCATDFDANSLGIWLENHYPVERIYMELNTVSAYISGVKTELMSHAYPLLDEISCIEGIRFASLKDLAAMKLNAISGRGLKKDFWDLAVLLNIFSMQEMLDFFKLKYFRGDKWHLLRSLVFFDDANNDTTPIADLGDTSWDEVKAKITLATYAIF